MQRSVLAELDLDLTSTTDLIFQISAAQNVQTSSENLTFRQGERIYTPTEIVDQSGSRLHRLTAEAGALEVRYDAIVEGQSSNGHTSDLEAITYLRPSRYCQSDEVFTQARRQFKGLTGHDLIAAVTSFVSTSTTYTPGLSLGTDSAVTTLMTGQGVCRDYAHVVIALLRAMDMPARYTACFAPGLRPMDFHAVAEAYHDGAWYVIDATRLANRRSLVRIATGRDAADCAFLSYYGGNVRLARMNVDAWVTDVPEGQPAEELVDPAVDDHESLVQLV
ncbi:MAG: transglutaminase family protein [Microbacterium sp.]|uniref:Transglutaminase family protein n=2 Tax=Microbacterium TaxID=33882 RepID=A0A0F0LWZ0_9MICO|nr:MULTISPECIES: transglutaminase family protein [Microbacterium]MAL07053.1 transglutaminase family protein [Microbacterium sp.]MCK9919749.1 transglutaminase family protein [Microbacteriaceae bacterium K1510]KJL38589.1 Transglutaminase-like superfamily protein [Microbacterium ginsengisoli]KQR92893.1 transglutaminase [Microbacterium sp. Leaf347]MBN9198859.1 transglutaminase family protein [Microbacterium ginsengisoli]